MDFGISGRTALVTGASRGLARAIARELVTEGARVAVASRDADRIRRTGAEIGAEPFVYDSADTAAAADLVAAVEGRLGPLDILVTSTGGPPAGGESLAFGEGEWLAAYRTLLRSPVELVRLTVPGMRRRGFGRVVNVSSTVAREPGADLMLSNSLRAATLAAFKTTAREVARDDVTLNSVLPGRIGTARMHDLYGSREAAEERAAAEVPAGRLGTEEELAAAAVFLCSARASYITGVGLIVDGGGTRLV